MVLKIYNTLSRKKDVFKPGKSKAVSLFVCGPTVYDFSHLGHARTYIAFDFIVKYLRQEGFDVFYLQNITDIDDKIIKRAGEKKIKPEILAKRFEKEYRKDMKNLKVDSVTKYARATDFIKEIISQVERLSKKGFTYRIKDGIYYDISKFKRYGKLSKRTALQAEDAVSRIDENREKKNKGDFCLWKISKPGEPKWKSPFGYGRPGWHIEDTAITEKFFGSQYDIHGGARDLIFPHHEAEIAQMEAVSGKSPLVKYWLHTGFLTVKGTKMAKSLGNFITVRDFLKDHSARLLRFLVIKSHYRSPLDYTENLILQSERELERIDEFVDKLKNINNRTKGKKEKYTEKLLERVSNEFEESMKNDFNTPKALSRLFELINKGNALIQEGRFNWVDSKETLGFLEKIDRIFNFIFWRGPAKKIPSKILKLAGQREQYRKRRNWEKADEIRKKIKGLGWQIEDVKRGFKLKKQRRLCKDFKDAS